MQEIHESVKSQCMSMPTMPESLGLPPSSTSLPMLGAPGMSDLGSFDGEGDTPPSEDCLDKCLI